jgi:hypothetical protein
MKELGNAEHATNAGDYITEERKVILKKLDSSQNTGFACYCTEEFNKCNP